MRAIVKTRLIYQILVLCLFITWANTAYATEEKYREKAFIFDRYGSPYSSASIILSSRAFCDEAKNRFSCAHYTQHDIWSRIATTALNTVSSTLLTVINHEVYGHGFRLRSLGIPCSYSIKAWGLKGGATHYRLFDRSLSADEQLMITIGGSEANSILAQQFLFKQFRNLFLDSGACSLFWEAYSDLPSYILSTYTSKEIRSSTGNDVMNYIREINHKHNSACIDINMLTRGALVFLLNPILYVSFWAHWDYLRTGRDTAVIPHVVLGRTRYMPLVRMGLAPFGLMYYVDNYIGHGNKVFLVSISSGHSPYYTQRYGGIQVQTDRLWAYKDYSLDAVGSLWYQPKLQQSMGDTIKDANYWGSMVGIENKLRLGKLVSLYASILYKNAGFVEGIISNSGAFVRVGFSMHY